MRTVKLFAIIVFLALLLGGFSRPTQVNAGISKVDQRVLDQIDSTGQAEFHVVMTVQADLSAAETLGSKLEKTTYVYNVLTRTAAETQGPLLSYLQAQDVTYESFYIYNMIEVTGGRQEVEWLASRPEVSLIVPPPKPEIDPVVHNEIGPQVPSLAAFGPANPNGVEWNIARLNADDVWTLSARGEGIVVGSNDTGADFDHPALVSHYRGNLGDGTFDHNYNWWAGDEGSHQPNDYAGHGTHTIGTMVGDDGSGNQVGMAPGAQWISCAGAGLGDATTVECFEFFLAPWDLNHENADPSKAPDVINNSWHDLSGYDYRHIVQNLHAAGIAVIFSAGNWGPGCGTINPPANVPEVITVAAFGQGDVIAGFSSRGPDSTYGDTILKPEVAAPGVNVRSAFPPDGYTTMDGTSMAAPHAAGLVALMWNAAGCLKGDVAATKQIMMDTAQPKIDGQCTPFVDHPNDVWGWGILDAQAAVRAAMQMCGGIGALEGTASDSSTGLPLEDMLVDVRAPGDSLRTGLTGPTGYYTVSLVSGTYSVTASLYGYVSQEFYPVTVTTGQVTARDFAMQPLPTHIVSGHVYDAASGAPIPASVRLTGTPLAPAETDPDGYYSLEVAEGTWGMLVTSPGYLRQTRVVAVDADVTVDFYLDPVPCILLVDDDDDSPETTGYYTSALDDMGIDYHVYDTNGGNGPDLAGMQGYKMLLWYTGDQFTTEAGPSEVDEANLAAYLDVGGKLMLDSQEYLFFNGLTAFGKDYLGIGSFTNDEGDARSVIGIPGDPIGDGLGPFNLTYPPGFVDYVDIVNGGVGASVSFKAGNNNNNLDIDKDGGAWQTAFFATSWVPIYNNNPANGQVVLQRVVDFFGGCATTPDEPIFDLFASNNSPTVLAGPTTLSASVTGGNRIHYEWDFGDGTSGSGSSVEHTYPDAGFYEATVHAYNDVSEQYAATTVTVVAVSLAPGAQAKHGLPGVQVGFAITVTNDAPVAQEVLLSVDAQWQTTIPSSTGVLAAGESVSVPVVVSIPLISGVIIGVDTFTLTASGAIGGEGTASGTTYANVNPSGDVSAPRGQIGKPLEVVSYDFLVINSGDYTDTFALDVSGMWQAVLPAGDTTGPLAAGESTFVTVLVTVPQGASNGESDVTTLKITSHRDSSVWAAGEVTTTAQVFFLNHLALILR